MTEIYQVRRIISIVDPQYDDDGVWNFIRIRLTPLWFWME